MKKILLGIFSVLSLLLVLNCSSTASVQKPWVNREWMLIEFGKFSKDELIKNEAKINLTAKEENGKIRGTAFMGCNGMFFSSEFKKDGKVKISDIGSTLKMCENIKLEDEFSKSFRKMTKYTLEGHFLILTDDEGHSMKFVASDWD